MNEAKPTGAKTVLVVGGTSGIGRAAAELFSKRDDRVIVASRSSEKVERTVSAIGPNMSGLVVDMLDQDSVDAAFSSLDTALDALVLTASSVTHGRFEDAAIKDVEATFASKLLGPYRVAKAALPYLRAGGSITFTSGVLSRRPGSAAAGLASVNAAVEGLGRALAKELAPRLRVNVLSPGMTQTEAYASMDAERQEAMFRAVGADLPVGRVARPEEIAEGIAFLVDSTFTTGHVLDLDGGHMVA